MKRRLRFFAILLLIVLITWLVYLFFIPEFRSVGPDPEAYLDEAPSEAIERVLDKQPIDAPDNGRQDVLDESVGPDLEFYADGAMGSDEADEDGSDPEYYPDSEPVDDLDDAHDAEVAVEPGDPGDDGRD